MKQSTRVNHLIKQAQDLGLKVEVTQDTACEGELEFTNVLISMGVEKINNALDAVNALEMLTIHATYRARTRRFSITVREYGFGVSSKSMTLKSLGIRIKMMANSMNFAKVGA